MSHQRSHEFALNYRISAKPDSAIDVLGKVFNLLGTPDPGKWTGVELLPSYIEFEHRDPLDLTDLLKFHQPEAKDLLLSLLALNPNERISAGAALKHAYFSTGEPPAAVESLPSNHKDSSSSPLTKRVKVEK